MVRAVSSPWWWEGESSLVVLLSWSRSRRWSRAASSSAASTMKAGAHLPRRHPHPGALRRGALRRGPHRTLARRATAHPRAPTQETAARPWTRLTTALVPTHARPARPRAATSIVLDRSASRGSFDARRASTAASCAPEQMRARAAIGGSSARSGRHARSSATVRKRARTPTSMGATRRASA